MSFRNFVLFLLIAVIVVSCKLKDDGVSPGSGTRTYYMGFTPFPYDVTSQALEYSYSKILSEADMVSHHFDDGIPWNEALEGTDFDPAIMSDWQYRKSKTPSGHKVLVSVTPINPSRDGLALYKGSATNMPLTPPWDDYSLSNPSVKIAYLHYCKRIIDYFNPDYFCMGIEVNLLIDNDPSLNKWQAYLNLQSFVYSQLKIDYPYLPIFVSFSAMELVSGYTNSNHALQMEGLDNIKKYTDYYALSLYPFLSNLGTDDLPSNFFDNIFTLSTKPLCITETGYPAQSDTVGTIIYNGTPDKQNNYFTKLFAAANTYNAKFIINFLIRDYDALWKANGSPDDINRVWKDTGLYDENGNARPADKTWKQKLDAALQQ